MALRIFQRNAPGFGPRALLWARAPQATVPRLGMHCSRTHAEAAQVEHHSRISTPGSEKIPALRMVHPGVSAGEPVDYMLMHPTYTEEELQVVPRHREPTGFRDKFALGLITFMRAAFDKLTGYQHAEGAMTEAMWLKRFIFLETVAGVPGFVAGMVRHTRSLRKMDHDHGWIHTLLEEAENERMHLMTFVKIKQPGLMFRAAVLGTQAIFTPAFGLCYLLSPKTCHRFVGYLEEEAVKTYTHALHDIDSGHLRWADKPAPKVAIDYWKLPQDATMRRVIEVIRADEAAHAHVNHTFGSIDGEDDNPFKKGVHAWEATHSAVYDATTGTQGVPDEQLADVYKLVKRAQKQVEKEK